MSFPLRTRPRPAACVALRRMNSRLVEFDMQNPFRLRAGTGSTQAGEFRSLHSRVPAPYEITSRELNARVGTGAVI